ncbi:uncharacterized protein LOC100574778 [Acyrthosiphon pisum]|uniref:Integrase catalytic domain-containing protein n=1 Tax=Acyrthosiphon pisum TaxID=7029 RepID=A0A8R1WYH5_ACYPI|nr:uncharacterized protein LOC100574778 [Acyrthosiphon pisum]|eukprot:XP_008178928.1 PREDICTED: uncharacterized protein LOC100574778 [Acyrthosiphon pisum]
MATNREKQALKQLFFDGFKTNELKRNNSTFLLKEKYDSLISEVKRIKTGKKESSRDYWLVQRYDVIEVQDSLKEMWPELSIIHGKPRHSQSQGSVERANQDIENMIIIWMKDNNTTKWSEGLRFIQFMKNKAFHRVIGLSPYESIEEAKECLERQAKRMKLQSDMSHPPALVQTWSVLEGCNVRVKIPDVNRSKCDPQSIIAIVLEKTTDGFYRLGTKYGVLKQIYARSSFNLCTEKFITLSDVPDVDICLRKASES